MQYSQTTSKTGNDDMSQVTMRKGYWFYFEHEQNDISVHGSAWSGRETVYVNNHPVSQLKNMFSRTGEHHFDIDGRPYHVLIKLEDVWKATVSVALYCENELIGQESKCYNVAGKHLGKKILFVYAASGGIFGFLAGKYIFPLIFG